MKEMKTVFETRLPPKQWEIWKNNRRQRNYVIEGLMCWADSPDEDDLETWVLYTSIETGKRFCRSLESFMGTNRDGQVRFYKIMI